MTEPCDLILIAYDGTPNAERAVDYAGRFLTAKRAVVLTAWEPLARQAARMSGLSGVMQPDWSHAEPLTTAELDGEGDVIEEDAKAVNAEGVARARNAGLAAEGMHVETASTVWSAIVDVANQLDADIIVTGTRGTTGIRSLLQSSVADHVLRHSHRPVLVVPPGQ